MVSALEGVAEIHEGAPRQARDTKSLAGFGGADGIRTHDLLDAIEARSQLRHGPTEGEMMKKL